MYAQMRGPKFSRRRRNPAPAVIVAIVALILGCWIFNITCGKGGREVSTSALTEYVNRVRPLIDTSTSVGSSWNSIRSSLPQLMADPDGLNQQLTGVEQSCLDLLEQAKGIEAPENLLNAHAALLICLEQRYRGAKTFRSDLVNSLNAVDLDVYARSISEDLQELMHSDGSYRFFRRAVSEALEKSNIKDVAPLTDSIWLADWENASYEKVKAMLTGLRGTEVHGVAVGTVALDPSGKVEEIGGEDIHRLPETDQLGIIVNVENQGNRTEKDVVVTVSLYTEKNPAPTRQEQTVSSINPGETLQVTFKDLRPTPGVRNILEVKVSPVPKESFLDNNQKLIYFTLG